jgi:O-antigen ligase
VQWPVPSLRRPLAEQTLPIALAGCFGALLVGVLVGRSPALGTMAALAVLFAPVVLIDLGTAVTLFTGTLFLRMFPGLGLGSNLIALVVVAGWVGALAGSSPAVRVAFGQLRGIVLLIVAWLLWLALSAAWSENSEAFSSTYAYVVFVPLMLMIVATVSDTERRLRAIIVAYVASAVVTILYGAFSGDLTAARAGIEGDEARFGGLGDPNELAMGLVPAIALVVGLLPGMRPGPRRLLAGAAIGLLLIGLVATQSRGGFVALGLGVVVTLVVAQGRRVAAISLTAIVLLFGAFVLLTTPGAAQRLSDDSDGGNGRSTLWRVAAQMFSDHPAIGVGFGQFRVESGNYVRELGKLNDVGMVVEEPKLVHNTYLELLAETGVIGTGLFLAIVAACFAAALRAARLALARGRPGLAAIAQSAAVAQVAACAAIFFLSVVDDPRLWLVLGLGPAALAVARSDAAAFASGAKR